MTDPPTLERASAGFVSLVWYTQARKGALWQGLKMGPR